MLFRSVTGINLPLMMEVVMGRYAEKSAQEVCKDLLKAAPETVKDVRELYKEVEG